MKLNPAFALIGTLLLGMGTVVAQDVVKISPNTNKVLVDNQFVRVLEATFKPGATEGAHTHPAAWYYVTRAGKLKVSYTSGKVQMWEPKVGESAWIDGEEAHTAENVGKTTLQYLMVEVKAAPTKTPN